MIIGVSPSGAVTSHGVGAHAGASSLELRYTVAPGGTVSIVTLRVGSAAAVCAVAPTATATATTTATSRHMGAMIHKSSMTGPTVDRASSDRSALAALVAPLSAEAFVRDRRSPVTDRPVTDRSVPDEVTADRVLG
jgi:hypothetical protein